MKKIIFTTALLVFFSCTREVRTRIATFYFGFYLRGAVSTYGPYPESGKLYRVSLHTSAVGEEAKGFLEFQLYDLQKDSLSTRRFSLGDVRYHAILFRSPLSWWIGLSVVIHVLGPLTQAWRFPQCLLIHTSE